MAAARAFPYEAATAELGTNRAYQYPSATAPTGLVPARSFQFIVAPVDAALLGAETFTIPVDKPDLRVTQLTGSTFVYPVDKPALRPSSGLASADTFAFPADKPALRGAPYTRIDTVDTFAISVTKPNLRISLTTDPPWEPPGDIDLEPNVDDIGYTPGTSPSDPWQYNAVVGFPNYQELPVPSASATFSGDVSAVVIKTIYSDLSGPATLRIRYPISATPTYQTVFNGTFDPTGVYETRTDPSKPIEIRLLGNAASVTGSVIMEVSMPRARHIGSFFVFDNDYIAALEPPNSSGYGTNFHTVMLRVPSSARNGDFMIMSLGGRGSGEFGPITGWNLIDSRPVADQVGKAVYWRRYRGEPYLFASCLPGGFWGSGFFNDNWWGGGISIWRIAQAPRFDGHVTKLASDSHESMENLWLGNLADYGIAVNTYDGFSSINATPGNTSPRGVGGIGQTGHRASGTYRVSTGVRTPMLGKGPNEGGDEVVQQMLSINSGVTRRLIGFTLGASTGSPALSVATPRIDW